MLCCWTVDCLRCDLSVRPSYLGIDANQFCLSLL